MKRKKDKSSGNNNSKLKNCFFIFDDFLERDVADELYKSILNNDFEKLPFIHKQDIDRDKDLINKVLYDTWFDKLPFLNDKDICGFEVWSNLMYRTGLHLHVDCDEDYYNLTQILQPPKYTSVLYLGPDHDLEGGELALNLNGIDYAESHNLDHNEHDPIANEQKNCISEMQAHVIRQDTKNWLTIPYRYNRLVVFDPHYPHCVLNIKKGTTKDTPRIGITMAAWDHEISIP